MQDADDRERVEAWLADGTLLAPLGGPPTTVDLAHAIGRAGGAPARGAADEEALTGVIDGERALVFVLVDGLGCGLLEQLPDDTFLRQQRTIELRAVFPSTTAAALTSLATGAWPGEHGVPAWFTYLPEIEQTATMLPFVERFAERPLQEYGLTPAQVFPCPSRYPTFTRPIRTYHPAGIARSEYTTYQRGSWPTDGYGSLEEAVGLVIEQLASDDGTWLHYLYLPMVDAAGHRHGAEASETLAALHAVDAALARRAGEAPAGAQIAVSADHGMVSVAEEQKHILEADDPLLAELQAPPHGEPRVPMFRPRRGRREGFAAAFHERFTDRFALLGIEDAEALELLGPGSLHPRTRARLGEFIGIAAERDGLIYGERGSGIAALRGFHAGLRPEEMRIPLILAGKNADG